jgi:hypothetical protein
VRRLVEVQLCRQGGEDADAAALIRVGDPAELPLQQRDQAHIILAQSRGPHSCGAPNATAAASMRSSSPMRSARLIDSWNALCAARIRPADRRAWPTSNRMSQRVASASGAAHQRGDRHPFGTGMAKHLAQRLAEGTGRLGVTHREQQQRRHPVQVAGEQPQQGQGCVVGGAQVVHDREHGSAGGRLAERGGDGLVGAELADAVLLVAVDLASEMPARRLDPRPGPAGRPVPGSTASTPEPTRRPGTGPRRW